MCVCSVLVSIKSGVFTFPRMKRELVCFEHFHRASVCLTKYQPLQLAQQQLIVYLNHKISFEPSNTHSGEETDIGEQRINSCSFHH